MLARRTASGEYRAISYIIFVVGHVGVCDVVVMMGEEGLKTGRSSPPYSLVRQGNAIKLASRSSGGAAPRTRKLK